MSDTTSTSADALHLFEEAVDTLLSWHNPFPQLTKALELDPQMCMAHCVYEVVLAMSDIPSSFKGPWPKGGNEREALHVKAAQAWCSGHQGDAELLYAQIVQRWPEDVLAVKFHQDSCFFLGRSSSMQAAERTADIWRKDRSSHKRYPFVLGLAAFAAEENARYADALLAGKEAVNLLPTEQWAIHAVGTAYLILLRASQVILR